MKKTAITTLTICVLCIAQITCLQAQTWPPAGMNGNGSSGSPWEIATADHLAALAAYVNAGNGNSTRGKYYILMNDIDLGDWEASPGDTCGWNPIGNTDGLDNNTTRFQGYFNGNGKVVSNMTINRSSEDCNGLFGISYGSTIQNLGVENCNIKGRAHTAGLVGYAHTSTISYSYATGNVNGVNYVGGLVGQIYSSAITKSYATCNVSGNNQIGGLVGQTYSSSVTDCYATGCLNGNSDIGGLVGYNTFFSTTTNSYATGNVNGNNYIGGLVGANGAYIRNCIAANDSVVAAQNTDFINRIAGYSNAENYTSNNYALDEMVLIENGIEITRTDDSRVNGFSKDLYTLKALGFYSTGNNWYQSVPWNIASVSGGVWTICDSVTYPFFQWQQIMECPYRIIATTGGGGTIAPLGFVVVDKEEDQLFTFIPVDFPRYYIDSVFVDGVYDAGAVANNSYTFTDVTENHTIHVTFATDVQTITATADSNGYISPSGDVLVDFGEEQTFTFIANPGFAVDSLLIDDVYVPDSIANGSYTFHHVTDTHTIRVTFKLDLCGGNGTASNPYQICTAEELALLAAYVNAGKGNATAGKYFILMNDIDLNGWEEIPGDTCGWKPIGNESSCFQGNFNGAGHVVKNLMINRSTINYIGLFGHVTGARIQNLGVKNCTIHGANFVGGIAGVCNASVISTSYATGNINGRSDIGGLIGYSNTNSAIINSYAGSHVHGSLSSVGGIAGSNWSNSTIADSYTTGNVNGNSKVGGLTGENYYSSITNSYAEGSVNGDTYVGGLVGYNTYSSTIENCVAANDTVAAIQNTTSVHRISGHHDYYNTLHNNYAFSGMVLKANGIIVSRPDDNNANGIGKSMDTLKTLNFYHTGSYWFSGIPWDIDPVSGEIWTICDQETFPYFRWQQNVVCTQYMITASAAGNGNITPSGTVIVNHGEDQTFTFFPGEGNTTVALFVDGVSVPVPEDNSYTFEDVTGNHTIHVDFAVGMEDYNMGNTVLLYPNPAADQVIVKILAGNDPDRDRESDLKSGDIKLYDIYGKVLQVIPLNSSMTPIDVNNLTSGVYLVRVDIGDKVITKKLIKK